MAGLAGLTFFGIGGYADEPIKPAAIPVIQKEDAKKPPLRTTIPAKDELEHDVPPGNPEHGGALPGHAEEGGEGGDHKDAAADGHAVGKPSEKKRSGGSSGHGAPEDSSNAHGETRAVAPDWIREKLLDGDPPHAGTSDRAIYEGRLAVARRRRSEGNLETAIGDLVAILKSAASNDVKRPALLELAAIAEESGQAGRAQQILSQYTRLFAKHPSVVEVYLRQGLLYREMGATQLALAKFHAVFSSALSQRFDQLEYYRRIVLQAQTEIAETYYLDGRWDEAREYFQRVLRLDAPRATKIQIQYKLIRALANMERHDQTAGQARQFIANYPDTPELPEVRFVLADALKKMGQNAEALDQVLKLLDSQKMAAAARPEMWAYWQKRAGNDIANQLYRDGDYLGTLEIYRRLSQLDPSAGWQLPVLYQIGLVYERLEQPVKASEVYDQIGAREPEVRGTNVPPNLHMVVEMAKWRKGNLTWLQAATANSSTLRPVLAPAPSGTPKNE